MQSILIKRALAAAALAVAGVSAHAALTTYAPWEAAYTANGLSGVLFDVNSAGGVTVALGAHGYKNGVSLPNDGQHVFTGQPGIYLPDGLGRANWSFDFGWDISACSTCSIRLGIDTDPTAGVNFIYADITSHLPNPESWNLDMGFLQAAYAFDPFASSSTAFNLAVLNAAGGVVVDSDITVNVGVSAVPEPGTLALGGLALAGLVCVRRRRQG